MSGAAVSFFFSPGRQVIDSIMALFRVDFSGRGELAERQQKLAQMLSRLQKISEGVRMCRLSGTNTVASDYTLFITMATMFFGLTVCLCAFRVQCCSVYHQPDDS